MKKQLILITVAFFLPTDLSAEDPDHDHGHELNVGTVALLVLDDGTTRVLSGCSVGRVGDRWFFAGAELRDGVKQKGFRQQIATDRVTEFKSFTSEKEYRLHAFPKARDMDLEGELVMIKNRHKLEDVLAEIKHWQMEQLRIEWEIKTLDAEAIAFKDDVRGVWAKNKSEKLRDYLNLSKTTVELLGQRQRVLEKKIHSAQNHFLNFENERLKVILGVDYKPPKK